MLAWSTSTYMHVGPGCMSPMQCMDDRQLDALGMLHALANGSEKRMKRVFLVIGTNISASLRVSVQVRRRRNVLA